MNAGELEYFRGMLVISGAITGFVVGFAVGKWPGLTWRRSALKGGIIGAILLALLPTAYIGAIGFLVRPPLKDGISQFFKPRATER